MNFSAAESSSAVVTPGRIFEAIRSMQRTWISPARAMASISAGDFLWITVALARFRTAILELIFEAERGERRTDVVVDLGRRSRSVEAPQDPVVLVVPDQRRRLLVIDGEALGDGLGLVVVAL